MEFDFVIHTPLMWLDKGATWKLAQMLGCLDYVYNNTLTCYEGVEGPGCGECPACKLRKAGFDEYRRREEESELF
jgi:7-cyano-7-deazaguanine synthase